MSHKGEGGVGKMTLNVKRGGGGSKECGKIVMFYLNGPLPYLT